MDAKLPDIAVAEHLAERIVAVDAGKLPAAAREKCEETLIDVVGLCIAARNEDYVGSALAGWDEDGPCTAIGHARALSAAGAAFVNGTAAHGEDFDDTFEGGPVHAGAVIVPAVLADRRALSHRRQGRAGRHRGRHRADVPARPRRAEDGAQGRLPSDRGVRRDGRGRRASARRSSSTGSRSSMRSASSARWRRASSNISPRAPGPSACTPAGRRSRACARRCWRARASPGRARCSRARTGSSTASPTPRPATSTR